MPNQLETFRICLALYRDAELVSPEPAAVRRLAIVQMNAVLAQAQNPVEYGGEGNGSFDEARWRSARDILAAIDKHTSLTHEIPKMIRRFALGQFSHD